MSRVLLTNCRCPFAVNQCNKQWPTISVLNTHYSYGIVSKIFTNYCGFNFLGNMLSILTMYTRYIFFMYMMITSINNCEPNDISNLTDNSCSRGKYQPNTVSLTSWIKSTAYCDSLAFTGYILRGTYTTPVHYKTSTTRLQRGFSVILVICGLTHATRAENKAHNQLNEGYACRSFSSWTILIDQRSHKKSNVYYNCYRLIQQQIDHFKVYYYFIESSIIPDTVERLLKLADNFHAT